MGTISEALVLDFIYRYGDKAYILLRAAYEIYQANILLGKRLPGDFDYKSLISKLREKKLSYNPTQLLRALERNLGVIETTYRSANQRWWRFTNPAAISKALDIYEGKSNDETYEDPEIALLKMQVEVVSIDEMLNELVNLLAKERLTSGDRDRIKELLFNDAQLIIKLFKTTQKYEEIFKDFNVKVRYLLKYLTIAVKKLKGVDISTKDLADHEVVRVELDRISQ